MEKNSPKYADIAEAVLYKAQRLDEIVDVGDALLEGESINSSDFNVWNTILGEPLDKRESKARRQSRDYISQRVYQSKKILEEFEYILYLESNLREAREMNDTERISQLEFLKKEYRGLSEFENIVEFAQKDPYMREILGLNNELSTPHSKVVIRSGHGAEELIEIKGGRIIDVLRKFGAAGVGTFIPLNDLTHDLGMSMKELYSAIFRLKKLIKKNNLPFVITNEYGGGYTLARKEEEFVEEEIAILEDKKEESSLTEEELVEMQENRFLATVLDWFDKHLYSTSYDYFYLQSKLSITTDYDIHNGEVKFYFYELEDINRMWEASFARILGKQSDDLNEQEAQLSELISKIVQKIPYKTVKSLHKRVNSMLLAGYDQFIIERCERMGSEKVPGRVRGPKDKRYIWVPIWELEL